MHSALLCLVLALPAAAQEKIPVLIVSGANNHDWERTTPILASILSESGKFAVDITYEPEKELAAAASSARYAAFLLDYNGPRWGPEAEQAFLAAVRGGVGVSVVHAANNAFPGWVDYETLVGHLWREGTGHGRFHPFDVRVLDRSHPITATLPELVQHPDELYHRLLHMHDSPRDVLAVAFSAPDTGGTGEDEPMVLVGTFGEGRMFHTPLGHVWRGGTAAAMEDPQFANLLVRGTEWAATGEVTDGLARPNTLTAEEARAGWRLLFDGQTTEGWRGWKKEGFPEEGWEVLNGCLRRAAAGGGDLVTTDTFTDFELAFEWKVAGGVNSGVKYRVTEDTPSPIAPEYQLLDDPHTEEDSNPLHAAAALYDVVAPEGTTLANTGAFNQSRIVCRGGHVEHWLNGVKVLEAEVGSDAWEQARTKSKFRGAADFAAPVAGHVLLQDHGGEVWYRSIRIRDLSAGEGQSLLQGEGLEGWVPVGGASWERDGDAIVGAVPEGGLGRNAFLRTERHFADFVFEVDLKIEVPGNSGIQFRSHLNDAGVVYGYQAEIDPSDRRWSGGVYDESRRGWLDDLKDDPAGQAAFQVDGWNHYRIECQGSHLRVWLNGVLTADLQDDADTEGFLALQVHGGQQGRFRWRDPRVREL